VAQMIDPANLGHYRAKAAALNNKAVFEVPAMIEGILELSGTGQLNGYRALEALQLSAG